jgi:hypothetical protein
MWRSGDLPVAGICLVSLVDGGGYVDPISGSKAARDTGETFAA